MHNNQLRYFFEPISRKPYYCWLWRLLLFQELLRAEYGRSSTESSPAHSSSPALSDGLSPAAWWEKRKTLAGRGQHQNVDQFNMILFMNYAIFPPNTCFRTLVCTAVSILFPMLDKQYERLIVVPTNPLLHSNFPPQQPSVWRSRSGSSRWFNWSPLNIEPTRSSP